MSPTSPISNSPPWWQASVIYQIYIRSFQDSNGDGTGDLEGIRQRLEYLKLLGVDGLWITPFYTSPMVDNGYDVSDPRGVDPLFGDLSIFDALMRDAHALGLRVIIDLVPNHTSDQHPWFQQALLAEPHSPARQRYHFYDGKGPTGNEPPSNWTSIFGGPAWSRVPDGQWYLHVFAPEQPDLNFDNAVVRDDLRRTMRFWLDRGVDGFRIDVGQGMAKRRGFPEMPEPLAQALEVHVNDVRFNASHVHDIHRMIRQVLDGYTDRAAVGEVMLPEDDQVALYARPDELHTVFNFRLSEAEWSAEQIRQAIKGPIETLDQVGSAPVWVLSTHDIERPTERYGGGKLGLLRARAAALLQLALPGSAYIYNGDELGLSNVDLPDEALQDPIWERSGHTNRGRDAARVPLPWSGKEPPFGFSSTTHTWLPMPEDWDKISVDAQLANSDSTLSLYQEALRLRRAYPSTSTKIEWLKTPEDCIAFRRSGGLTCVVNAGLSEVSLPSGEVLLASGPVDDKLPPDTAVWLATD